VKKLDPLHREYDEGGSNKNNFILSMLKYDASQHPQ